jgi:hypothetical protein
MRIWTRWTGHCLIKDHFSRRDSGYPEPIDAARLQSAAGAPLISVDQRAWIAARAPRERLYIIDLASPFPSSRSGDLFAHVASRSLDEASAFDTVCMGCPRWPLRKRTKSDAERDN